VISADSLERLPSALIQARIATGLSQKQLAERLGLKEQQVQRYEANDYQGASLGRLHEVVTALESLCVKSFFFQVSAQTPSSFFSRLKGAGLERDFVLRSNSSADNFRAYVGTLPVSLGDRRQNCNFNCLSHIPMDGRPVPGGSTFSCQHDHCGTRTFQGPIQSGRTWVSAYAVYAHYIALLVLEGNPQSETGARAG